jgi:excinuclease ABC subunit A
MAVPVGNGGAVVAAGTPAQVAENGVGASAEYLAAAIKLSVAAI